MCVCGVFRPRVLARVQLNVTIQRHRVTTGLNLELLCPHHALSNRENFSSSRSLALELTISLSSSRPLALELLTRGAHVALVRRRRRLRLRRAAHRRRRIGASHNCRLLVAHDHTAARKNSRGHGGVRVRRAAAVQEQHLERLGATQAGREGGHALIAEQVAAQVEDRERTRERSLQAARSSSAFR